MKRSQIRRIVLLFTFLTSAVVSGQTVQEWTGCTLSTITNGDGTTRVVVTCPVLTTATPVNEVCSAWVLASATNWSACVQGQHTRTETWTRTVITPASNGGASCGPKTETRTATQACTPPPPPQPVYDRAVLPTENLATVVDGSASGTVFWLRAGVHRLTKPINAKGDMVFLGEAGAILSGARLLTSFTREGSLWVASGQTQQGQVVNNQCKSGFQRCAYPEDLYLNDVLLKHVSAKSAVVAGTWFFDYAADKMYFADDPTGKRVETTVILRAFEGAVADVLIDGLVIEKFANPTSHGAILGHGSTNWTIQNSELRFNHGMGIHTMHGMKVLNTKLHHNGQMGIGGQGNDVLIDGVEIAYNNTAGYNWAWEAGGTKFVATQRLIVRNTFSHHNEGPGLWTDINNIDTTYEDNRVEDNLAPGIFHEISYGAVIRRNQSRRNGRGCAPSDTAGVYCAGILVANSPNVQVYENVLEDNHTGLLAFHENRGTGTYGQWTLENFSAHANTIVQRVGVVAALMQSVGDLSLFTSKNNRFTANIYTLGVASTQPRPFAWQNGSRTEAEWRTYGQDLTGLFQRQ
jgi:hypothetical protein